MKMFISASTHLLLGIFAITLIGCSPKAPDTSGSNADGGTDGAYVSTFTPITNTVEISDEVPKEAASSLETVAGFSFPKNNGETFSHDITRDLPVKFWAVASAESLVTLSVNGAEYDLAADDRPDVKRLYPNHAMCEGYSAVIPVDKLKMEGNEFTIRVNGDIELYLMLSIN